MSNLPPNRHPFEVQAIQLRSYPYGESDLIVVLFTREYGVIRAMARGVRKARSRMSGLISPLRCNHLMLKRGRNLHGISQAESIHSFAGIHDDYDRLMAGLAIGELVSQFCQEEDAQPEFYDSLLTTLFLLSESPQPRTVLLWFLLYFLESQGFYSDWQKCQQCESSFEGREYRFQNVVEGGLRCERCKQGPDHRFLSEAQALALPVFQQAVSPPEHDLTEKELNGLIWNLQQQLQQLAGRELRTFSFLYPTESLQPSSAPTTTPPQRGIPL